MAELDKWQQKLWLSFLKGVAGDAEVDCHLKDHALNEYNKNLKKILKRKQPKKNKDLALSMLCARRTGEFSASMSGDGSINSAEFDAAADLVRDEYNNGGAGPLCD